MCMTHACTGLRVHWKLQHNRLEKLLTKNTYAARQQSASHGLPALREGWVPAMGPAQPHSASYSLSA